MVAHGVGCVPMRLIGHLELICGGILEDSGGSSPDS